MWVETHCGGWWVVGTEPRTRLLLLKIAQWLLLLFLGLSLRVVSRVPG